MPWISMCNRSSICWRWRTLVRLVGSQPCSRKPISRSTCKNNKKKIKSNKLLLQFTRSRGLYLTSKLISPPLPFFGNHIFPPQRMIFAVFFYFISPYTTPIMCTFVSPSQIFEYQDDACILVPFIFPILQLHLNYVISFPLTFGDFRSYKPHSSLCQPLSCIFFVRPFPPLMHPTVGYKIYC